MTLCADAVRHIEACDNSGWVWNDSSGAPACGYRCAAGAHGHGEAVVDDAMIAGARLLSEPTARDLVQRKQLPVTRDWFDDYSLHAAMATGCCVCLDAVATHVLLPCLHTVLCSDCVGPVAGAGRCPLCRSAVASTKCLASS